MTIQEEWDKWHKQVYPVGMTPSQAIHLERAFMSGCLTCFVALQEAAKLPEEEAMKATQQVFDQIAAASRDVMKRHYQESMTN